MHPKIYGREHIVFLLVFFILTFFSWCLIKKYAKSERVKNIIIKIVALGLLASILCNRIAIFAKNLQWNRLIPNSFCGMDSLVLSLALLFGKKNNAILHFVVYVAFVGGLGTIFYPTFIDTYTSFFNPITFSGMLHHALSFYLCVVVQLVGWFKPDYHKWKNLLIGFLAYIALGAFLIYVLDVSTAFYINEPMIEGTSFTIWIIAPVFAVGYAIYMLCYELITRKIAMKKDANEHSFNLIMKTIKSDYKI